MARYSVLLREHEKSSLTVGEYSLHNPPPARTIEIHATNRDLVKYHVKKFGGANHYRLAYEIGNRNDSPAELAVVTDEPDPAS
jgi:hypothetical protein